VLITEIHRRKKVESAMNDGGERLEKLNGQVQARSWAEGRMGAVRLPKLYCSDKKGRHVNSLGSPVREKGLIRRRKLQRKGSSSLFCSKKNLRNTILQKALNHNNGDKDMTSSGRRGWGELLFNIKPYHSSSNRPGAGIIMIAKKAVTGGSCPHSNEKLPVLWDPFKKTRHSSEKLSLLIHQSFWPKEKKRKGTAQSHDADGGSRGSI